MRGDWIQVRCLRLGGGDYALFRPLRRAVRLCRLIRVVFVVLAVLFEGDMYIFDGNVVEARGLR